MKTIQTITLSIALALGTGAQAQQSDEQAFREYVSTLASDDFGGRAPLTEYETKSINYIAGQFKAIGLQPAGDDGTYFQKVPLLQVSTRPAKGVIDVKTPKGKVRLKNWDDLIITSVRGKEVVKLPKAQFVFAGFGINAPEYGWNDYEGLDVRGKIAVVLVNDPGYYDPQLFRGKDMTYYGRWIYKFEEASRQGAAGVLVVHDTEPASYGWNVVQASWGSVNLSLYSEQGNADKVALQGWISLPAARRLFEGAGEDFDAAVAAAKKPGFRAIALDAVSNVTLENRVRIADSYNVAAVLPGTDRKEEHLIYSAHWDHFGIQRPIDGDSIYNGASDNASGVAALLVLARKFAALKQRPARSILFLAVTAEEAVLLGSDYYAHHPLVPLKNSVANINIDGCAPQSPVKNVIIRGYGDTNTDLLVEETAAAQGRTAEAAKNQSSGGYFRSDHFSFAKVGVPVILAEAGRDYVDPADAERYKGPRTYHMPTDEYSPSWDLRGTLDDINLWFGMGLRIANGGFTPQWTDQAPWKAVAR